MRRATGILLGLIILSLNAHSQKITGTVRGRIVDTAARQNLSGASVSVVKSADSSADAFSITDKLGEFVINNLAPGSYRLFITYEGYSRIAKRFFINDTSRNVDF
jgi:uncharacterized surface anchored protein